VTFRDNYGSATAVSAKYWAGKTVEKLPIMRQKNALLKIKNAPVLQLFSLLIGKPQIKQIRPKYNKTWLKKRVETRQYIIHT
jgi:hypothetical protein